VPVLRRQQRMNLFLLTGTHFRQLGCQVSTLLEASLEWYILIGFTYIPVELFVILQNSLTLLFELQKYCYIAQITIVCWEKFVYLYILPQKSYSWSMKRERKNWWYTWSQKPGIAFSSMRVFQDLRNAH
jgi:hypothetical protein